LKDISKALLIGLSSRILVMAVFAVCSVLFTTTASSPVNPIPIVSLFSRWDSGWYREIAKIGYPLGTPPKGEWAFFPLYPVAMSGLSTVFLPFFSSVNALNLAGFIISNVSFFVSVYFFYKLTNKLLKNAKIAMASTVFYCFFAGAVFYSAIYSESLFMALALASFYYLEDNQLYKSVLFGFLASFTRSDGFLICLPFVVSALFSNRNKIKTLKLSLSAAIIASPFFLFQAVGYILVGVFPISLLARTQVWGTYPPLLIQFFVYPLQVHDKTGYQMLYTTGFMLMLLPIIYICFSETLQKSQSLHDLKNYLVNNSKMLQYWSYYISTLILVFTTCYIGSTIRYSITMLPIYWASAAIYGKNRLIGIALFTTMIATLIIGSYLLEINGYFM